MKNDNGIKEAKGKLETMSEDERMQILADLRLKAIMDEKAVRRLGYKEGKEEGKKEKTIEIAKKMKEKNIDIIMIKETTGLTKEEIEKL